MLKDDLIIKKYKFINKNNINLNINFLLHSKVKPSDTNEFSARVIDDIFMQYNHDYTMGIFSNQKINSYQLHDINQNFETGNIGGKDYIGMSSNSGISYDIGELKPGESREFVLYIYMKKNKTNESNDEIQKVINKYKKIDSQKKLQEVKTYWKKYLQEHMTLNLKDMNSNIIEIYKRSILMFPLLINKKTGAIIAAPEADENKKHSGGYAYCWPRDAVFISKAFDILKMHEETNEFYLNFCSNTQSENGMWQQRFYSNGNLAPCWGYQVDETASVIFGVYEHFKEIKDINFLKKCVKMCENATDFLIKYIENILNVEEIDVVKKEILEKHNNIEKIEEKPSYDLWEMNEGIHLYSLCSIYAAFDSMINIQEELKQNGSTNRIKEESLLKRKKKLEKYKNEIKKYIEKNLYDEKQKILYRNSNDKNMDISILGSVIPFKVFKANEKTITNTVEKINMTLRTYTGGYLRFEGDSYRDGNCPWVITTLWMALYYIKINNRKKAQECFNLVVNSANEKYLLAEQIDNSTMKPSWIIGLGWSHAMFIIVLNELIDKEL